MTRKNDPLTQKCKGCGEPADCPLPTVSPCCAACAAEFAELVEGLIVATREKAEAMRTELAAKEGEAA